MAGTPLYEPSGDDLDWDLDPPTSRSGVMPVATVRPTFDPAAYARESEERMAIASFVPTTPAPRGPATEVTTLKTTEPSAGLRALLKRDEPL